MSQAHKEIPQKKYFCHLGHEALTTKNAKLWVVSQNLYHNEYIFLDKKQQHMFKDVSNNDILMIYCHGSPKNDTEGPYLWLDNFRGDINQKTKKPLPEIAYTPEQFLDFISSHGLDKNHKTLKLVACYSHDFAKELSSLSANLYPNLTVIGFNHQIVIGQGRNGRIIAGLKPPLVYKVKEESELKEDESVTWEINSTLFNANKLSNQKKYDDDNQQKIFKNGIEITKEHKQENADSIDQIQFSKLSISDSTSSIASIPTDKSKETAGRSSISYTDKNSPNDDNIQELPTQRRHSTSSIANMLNITLINNPSTKRTEGTNNINDNKQTHTKLNNENALTPNNQDEKGHVDSAQNDGTILTTARRKSF